MKSKKLLIKTCLASLFFLVLISSCQSYQEQSPTAVLPSETASTPSVWTYVVLGDSTTRGYPQKLAAEIEENQGVKVEIKNWSQNGDHSSKLLERLQTNDGLRQQIQDAQLITFVIPWNVFEGPIRTYISNSPEKCGGNDNQDCLREALATYKSDTESIVAEIVALRNPEKTIVLAHDVWQFNVTTSKESGYFNVLNHYWQEANAQVHAVCDQYSIPVARVYDAFMGPDNSKNPEEDGLIYDGFHTTSEGQEIIVDLLMALIVQ